MISLVGLCKTFLTVPAAPSPNSFITSKSSGFISINWLLSSVFSVVVVVAEEDEEDDADEEAGAVLTGFVVVEVVVTFIPKIVYLLLSLFSIVNNNRKE